MREPASLAAWGPARMAVGPGRARIRRSGRGLAGRLSFHRGATCLARHPGAAVLPLHLGRRSGRCCMHLHSLPPGQGPGAGVACLAGPLATLAAVAGFLILNTAPGGKLSARFVVGVAQAPLALGLLFCLTAALAG